MVCSPYLWMPPVHTQHRESMLCQTKGVSICPIYLDTPMCLTAPVCLDAPMFGCPLYIHNTKKACFVRLRGCPYASNTLDAPICLDVPPVCLNASLCLDDPCMFGCPNMFGHLLYVWMPPITLDIPICLAAPICLHSPVCLGAPFVWTPLCWFDAPTCLDTPLYVLMLSICLAAPCMFGFSPKVWGIQRYEGHPNI